MTKLTLYVRERTCSADDQPDKPRVGRQFAAHNNGNTHTHTHTCSGASCGRGWTIVGIGALPRETCMKNDEFRLFQSRSK